MPNPEIFGVTGQMGCGKTHLCRLLVAAGNRLGIPVHHVEVDALRTEILGTNGAVISLLTAKFGHGIASPDGGIDRAKLADIIFNDDAALSFHDEIIGPLLHEKLSQAILDAQDGFVLVDWALLADESRLSPLVPIKNFLAVTCPPDEQQARLSRGDLSGDQIRKRLSRQPAHRDRIQRIRAEGGHVIAYWNVGEPNLAAIDKLLKALPHSRREVASSHDFCLFRIPENGKRVIWQLTNRCNYHCSYCVFASNSSKVPGELATGTVFGVIENLRATGYSHVKFTGGEPFSRPDIMDILERACAAGLNVDVSTNATYVTEGMARRLAEMAIEMVHVSLDGHDSRVHEAVRGPGTFRPTVNGIRRLVENNVRVRIGCVIHSGNENNLRDIVSTCEDLGVDELVFSYMEPAGRVRPGDPSLPHRDDASILAQIAGVHAVKVRCNFPGRENSPIGLCPGGERFLYIDNLGRLSPCSWIGENPSFRTAASLKEIPLERLLTDESLLAYRSWLKTQAPGCPIVNGSMNS